MVKHGRNGESPIPIIAAQSPTDCFYTAIEAWRIATKFMTPIFILSDGYIANGAEPWRIPVVSDLPPIKVIHPLSTSGDSFLPYERDENLARPWALPGTAGLAHRIGGLEKQNRTGNVSYEPENHQLMVNLRAAKVAGIAKSIEPLKFSGPTGNLLVLSWGGTYGSCRTAVETCQKEGLKVAHAHLRWLNPFPPNLGQVLGQFKHVLIPELNTGQLRMIINSEFDVPTEGLNKVQGKPFRVGEIVDKIRGICTSNGQP
jgi:2-oxoglutarate ferredoxin oxidoreductase subunit alpha